MTTSKRCFSTVTGLQKVDPRTLADLLRSHSEYMDANGIVVPVHATEDNLDYPAIRDALMGDGVPESLDDILYLATRLGNARYWGIVEKQAVEDRRILPPLQPDYGYVDAAIRAEIQDWPKHKGFLEKANARARIHGKSSYVYYPPAMDPRGWYRTPDAAGLEEARMLIAEHFFQKRLVMDRRQAMNTQIIVYDFQKEIWFLVRYPGKKSRHSGTDSKGVWRNFCFNPEQYDAIVYNKVYGDLRMNTNMAGDHAKYRIAISHLLFDRGNIFQPKAKVVTLKPFLEDNSTDLFGCKDIPGMDWIAPVRLRYETWGLPVKVYNVWHQDGSSLLAGNEHGTRLVPRNALAVTQVELAYKLTGREKLCKVTLHIGNRVCYERDGDSVVLEDWLRRRGVLETFVPLVDHGPEYRIKIGDIAVGE